MKFDDDVDNLNNYPNISWVRPKIPIKPIEKISENLLCIVFLLLEDFLRNRGLRLREIRFPVDGYKIRTVSDICTPAVSHEGHIRSEVARPIPLTALNTIYKNA